MAGRVRVLGGHGKAPLQPWSFLLNGGVLLVWGQVRVGYRRLVRGKVFCAGGPPSEPVPQGRHTGCCVSSADPHCLYRLLLSLSGLLKGR